MKIRIVTDSSSCISQDTAKEYGIDVVALNINIKDQSYIDGVDIDAQALCALIDNGRDFPKTSQPSPSLFMEIFESAKAKNDAVICVLMSSFISGTYQAAMLAKDIVGYENVRIVDSLQFVGGLEILVDEAYRLRETLSLDELVEHLESFKKKIHIYAVVDTLTYLQRGGRLSKMKAIIGNILSLKPIVYFPEGHGDVKGTYHGRKGAHKALFSIIEEDQIDLSYPVYFGYSRSDAHLKELMSQFHEKYGMVQCVVTPLGAGMLAHVGPDAAAIYFVEKGTTRLLEKKPVNLSKVKTLEPSMFEDLPS